MSTNAIRLFFAAMPTVISTGLCHAQAQQYLLDTMGEGTGVVYPSSTTFTTDGGTILHLTTTQGSVQWKMDQAGQPMWCKQYEIASERKERMPDGGVVFCELTDFLSQGDTTFNYLQIVRTDAQGAIVWSKLLTIHDPYNNLYNNLWIYIASDEEGNCLITMSEVWDNAYQWFYCLDANGEVLWSNNFLFNPNAEHVEHICSDGFGGWYFGSYDQGASVFRLGRLNNFGDMAWYNSYSVPGPEFWLGGLCSMGFQAIAVGGYDAVADDDDYRWFVMRLNLNGTLDWFRVSATTQTKLSHPRATSAGELLVSGGMQGYPANYMARLSGTGEVISSFQPATHTAGGLEYATWFVDWDHLDTTLSVGGLLEAHNEDFSELNYRPALWRLPISDLSACGAEPMELSSVLGSNSAVAVQEQPYSEVVVPFTITDTVCMVTDFTPIAVSDYCYYFTGIPPVEQATTRGRVLTTLLGPGEPITAMAPESRCSVIVHDAHGNVLYKDLLAAHGTELIPTSGWSPGLYFVRFQPEDGGRPNVVKVVIE